MSGSDLMQALRAARVVPVVRTASATHAATAVRWLHDAGLRIFEITMTIPDAPALIRELASDPSLLVGAGTVPDAATAEACLQAGARFIVAPWTDPALAAPCRAAGARADARRADPERGARGAGSGRRRGEDLPGLLGRRAGPYQGAGQRVPRRAFCPTGGVEPGNVAAYLGAGAAFVGMGGALVDEKRIAAGDRRQSGGGAAGPGVSIPA